MVRRSGPPFTAEADNRDDARGGGSGLFAFAGVECSKRRGGSMPRRLLRSEPCRDERSDSLYGERHFNFSVTDFRLNGLQPSTTGRTSRVTLPFSAISSVPSPTVVNFP